MDGETIACYLAILKNNTTMNVHTQTVKIDSS
ncbi:hypothetical protein KORDIASMS9_01474 [Kordia sp. SMS9]|nr:hypothetical protein KORDIASMS9_01474 [Kordia sp. SMS9]